jgi:hypothetical protein
MEEVFKIIAFWLFTITIFSAGFMAGKDSRGAMKK